MMQVDHKIFSLLAKLMLHFTISVPHLQREWLEDTEKCDAEKPTWDCSISISHKKCYC